MPTTATTLSIDRPLLLRVQKAYGFKTKTETIDTALKKMDYQKAVDDLVSMFGTIEYYDDYNYKDLRRRRREKLDRFNAENNIV